MQDRSYPLYRAARSLAALALPAALFLLTPRAQAQSGGPLVSWRDDVSEGIYADNPDPDGDSILTGTQVVATPVSGTPSGTFKAVALGFYHCVAIKADGTLVSWGDDSVGQISGTPTGTFKAVAAGNYHSVAIRSNGSLAAWGNDPVYGGVDGTTVVATVVSSTPKTGTYTAVAAGELHSLALRSDGTLVAWGNDQDGQVSGTPTTGTYTAVAAGTSFCVALRSDGTLVAWGDDTDRVVSGRPTGVYKAIAAGSHHAVAIRWDGTLISWGSDPVIGDDGSTVIANVVSSTPATGTYVAVSAGNEHTLALRSDGALVSWGDDANGQVSATPSGAFQAIAAGGDHSTAIRGYSWSGFLPPINTDNSSVFKLGSTVPVKFQLTGPSAAVPTLAATLTFSKLSNGVPGPVNEAVSTSSGDSGNTFRYDATSGTYIFNWSTKGLTTGTYQLQVNLGDGLSSHVVNVGLR